MAGSITASCGHKVANLDQLETVIWGGEECDAVDGFIPAYFTACYCPACAQDARTWPEYLPSIEAADDWLETAGESLAHRDKQRKKGRWKYRA